MKILITIPLILKSANEISNDKTYDLADRVFKFMYTYVKPSFDDKPKFSSLLYSLGEMLLYHFDSVDHEKTMQFYYPVVMKLGEKKLADISVSEEEKMFINFTLASIAGLSGDTAKGESYFDASLHSFINTDNYRENLNEKKTY